MTLEEPELRYAIRVQVVHQLGEQMSLGICSLRHFPEPSDGSCYLHDRDSWLEWRNFATDSPLAELLASDESQEERRLAFYISLGSGSRYLVRHRQRGVSAVSVEPSAG